MLKKIYRFLNPRFQTLFLEYKVDMRPRYGHGRPPHKELYDIIEQNRTYYSGFIDSALSYYDEICEIKKTGEEEDRSKPVWNNGFLPGLDIIAIYTMIASLKPGNYLEIGSGNSTKVAYKAKKNHSPATQIISVDPMPRAEIDVLADKIYRQPFETLDWDIVPTLGENDILFIDNSHRILPNSDSMVFFMEILPRLKKGVIVHIHDIYLPYDYPQFMCDRFYSEQYGLAFYLLSNPEKYKVLFPNYFISEDSALSEKLHTFWQHPNLQGVEKHGGSFWFMINE